MYGEEGWRAGDSRGGKGHLGMAGDGRGWQGTVGTMASM